jgi:hypothetical protein
MADFPALEPYGRSFDFGDFAMSEANAFAGGSMRFTHSDEALGHGLSLQYLEISDANMTAIRDHYREQQGGYLSFELPAIIWQGHLSVETIVPAVGRWKYAGPLEEEHLPGKLFNVTVPLQYVGASATS